MKPWQQDLVAFSVFLVLALLSIFLMRLLPLEDGFTTYVVILSAILMLYLRLRMSLRRISEGLGLSAGAGTGTMGASSSAFNTGYSLSKSLVTLAENGESLLLDLALLRKDVYRSLEQLRRDSEKILGMGHSLVGLASGDGDVTEEVDSDSDL